MKDYNTPLIEVLCWGKSDIITSSVGVFDENNGEYIEKDDKRLDESRFGWMYEDKFAKAIMKTIDRVIYAEEQKEHSIETEVLGDDVKLPAETKEDKDTPNIDELPRDDGDIDI